MATIKAYSKVNLVLKVYPKKPRDLKHRIQSFMVLDKTLYDQITLTPHHKLVVDYWANGELAPVRDCTAIKAIRYLEKIFKIQFNYQIVIYKKIPFMSGLGGSATDAAAVVLYLLKMHHKTLTPAHIKYLALHIGSDIPFFLSQLNSAQVSGFGEKVHKLNIGKIRYAIHLTSTPIMSQLVYQTLDRNPSYKSQVHFGKCLQVLQHHQPLDRCFNDLQPYIFKISKLLQYKYNLLNPTNNTCIVTGSGGTIIKIWK